MPYYSRFLAYLYLMTVQALREVFVFDQAVLLLPCWTNNHCPRPGLNVVIKSYKLALLPTASIDKAFLVIGMQFSIGKMIKKKTIRLPCTQLIEPITIFVTGGCNCATL